MTSTPDARFAALEPARFLARLSRFHGTVRRRDSGEEVVVHIPNSGRLREVLRPGAPAAIVPRPGGGRKTSHDLVLVAVPGSEQGPLAAGWEDANALAEWWGQGAPRVWASIDTRLPPRIVAAAAARGAVPGLEGAEVLATEPRVGFGRADLLLAVPGRSLPTLVEVKSTTLVRDGVALFPDSPTLRGAAQVAALAMERGPSAVVVVCQRPDAASVAPHAEVDQRFAATLADAVAMGLEVSAGVCTAGLHGIRWERAVPVRGVSAGVDRRRRPGDAE